jgi:hypothetical protein
MTDSGGGEEYITTIKNTTVTGHLKPVNLDDF